MVTERIPGKRNTGSKIVLICLEIAVLDVQFVAEAVVKNQVWPDGPLVLSVKGGKRSGGDILGIVKALLVELGQTQRNRL